MIFYCVLREPARASLPGVRRQCRVTRQPVRHRGARLRAGSRVALCKARARVLEGKGAVETRMLNGTLTKHTHTHTATTTTTTTTTTAVMTATCGHALILAHCSACGLAECGRLSCKPQVSAPSSAPALTFCPAAFPSNWPCWRVCLDVWGPAWHAAPPAYH